MVIGDLTPHSPFYTSLNSLCVFFILSIDNNKTAIFVLYENVIKKFKSTKCAPPQVLHSLATEFFKIYIIYNYL